MRRQPLARAPPLQRPPPATRAPWLLAPPRPAPSMQAAPPGHSRGDPCEGHDFPARPAALGASFPSADSPPCRLCFSPPPGTLRGDPRMSATSLRSAPHTCQGPALSCPVPAGDFARLLDTWPLLPRPLLTSDRRFAPLGYRISPFPPQPSFSPSPLLHSRPYLAQSQRIDRACSALPQTPARSSARPPLAAPSPLPLGPQG